MYNQKLEVRKKNEKVEDRLEPIEFEYKAIHHKARVQFQYQDAVLPV